MAVFRYKAQYPDMEGGEEQTELGTIRAKDESEATAKLNQYGFRKVRLERIRGISALWKSFTADFK